MSEPINDEPATCANEGTVGFKCSSPEQVQQLHDTAVAHGGVSIEEPPGLRGSTLGAKRPAYVRNPDGKMQLIRRKGVMRQALRQRQAHPIRTTGAVIGDSLVSSITR